MELKHKLIFVLRDVGCVKDHIESMIYAYNTGRGDALLELRLAKRQAERFIECVNDIEKDLRKELDIDS